MSNGSKLAQRIRRGALALVLWIGSLVAYLFLYRILGPNYLGPSNNGWDILRRRCVHSIDKLIQSSSERGVFQTDIEPNEYVGTIDTQPEEVTRLLWEADFHRNLISGIRFRDGAPEISSWVYRESPSSRRQIHVQMFPGEEPETTDLYAHEEYSSVNPKVAVEHYRGIGKDVEAGVKEVRDRLSSLESTMQQDFALL